MFCIKCGSELTGSGRFCSKCGAPVAEMSNTAAMEENANIKKTKKSEKKKKLPLLAAVLVVICVISAATGYFLWKKSSMAEYKDLFEDFLVERCVREALGKDWDEAITAEELASIKELTISWKKGITVGLDPNSYRLAYSGYVNLADLQYLTGLESLKLDFYQKNDIFENLDAIANCKNLKSLAMPLVMDGSNYTNGYVGRGYSYLADIFTDLPALEKVDFGVAIPEQLQKRFLENDPDREIFFAEGGEDFESYIRKNYQVYFARNSADEEASVKIGTTEEFTLEMEDAVIYVDEGEVFDCKSLLDYKNLKTLVIYNEKFNIRDGASIQVINLESLAKLPYLSSLSLANAKVNLSGIGKLSCLKELYLIGCDMKGTSGLKELSSLRELSIVTPRGQGVALLSTMWEQLPKLRYFYGHLYLGNSEANKFFRNIKDAANLETLVLISGDTLDVKEALDGLALKTLFLYTSAASSLDLNDIKHIDSLENLYCPMKADHLARFIEEHPNLTSVSVGGTSWKSEKDLLAYYNGIIKAASKNENMSMLMIQDGIWTSATTREEWQNIRKQELITENIELLLLHKSGIYDGAVQRGAFMRDIDVQTYYNEIFY